MDLLIEIAEALERGDAAAVGGLTKKAIDQRLEPEGILRSGLIEGMRVVGDKFKAHEIFLPDVLLAARAMYAGMDVLRPLFIKGGIPIAGKVVIGTVQGDLHDIGKNLVGIMLRGAGFEVIDLGKDVTPEAFVETAEREGAAVIGMSALLTTTRPVMKKVVELARAKGLSPRVKIIIGGAPVSSEYATEIGADAYCFDGMNAVDRVKSFLGVS